MFRKRPKRKRTTARRQTIRWLLILVMIAPTLLIAAHPRFSQSLLADGIAISVLLCAAVYLGYQAACWIIARYLGLLDQDPNPSDADDLHRQEPV